MEGLFTQTFPLFIVAKYGGDRETQNANTNAMEQQQNEIAKRNIEEANAAWRDLSQYITIPEGEETTLRFFPLDNDGIQVKQDTYQGQPSGFKTFYKVVDVGSDNTANRIFKANRASTKLINKELQQGNYVLRLRHEGSGTTTIYRPTPVKQQ